MKITIEQPELEQAVRDYVRKNGVTRHIESVDFTASRSEAGTVTTITLGSDADLPAAPVVDPEPATVTALAPAPAAAEEPPAAGEEDVSSDDSSEAKAAPKRLFGDVK